MAMGFINMQMVHHTVENGKTTSIMGRVNTSFQTGHASWETGKTT